MITVRELIEQLQTCNPDDVVVMSKDAEGNCYSPFCDLDDNWAYEPTTTWYGEVALRQLTSEMIDLGHTEEDFYMATEDMHRCVILCPVN